MEHAHKILVIEDDRFIGEMYVQALRRAGYTVDWTVSGQEGQKAVATKQYDLILLDIMLPEKLGTEILTDLRGGEDKIPGTKILVMTNFEQDEHSRAAVEAQADGYLIKADITPRKLLDIIADLLKS